MTKKHEQFIADKFFEYFGALRSGISTPPNKMALDGQDAILGADYLINNATKFSLIEFKFEEKDIKTENKKPLRKKLCEALNNNKNLLSLHEKCHYISFFNEKMIFLNVYAYEVCCKAVFTSNICHVKPSLNVPIERMNYIQFTDDFAKATSKIGLCARHFQLYIDKLCNIAGTDPTSIELVAMAPNGNNMALVKFNSIAALHLWYTEQYLPRLNARHPTSENKKPGRGPFER